MTDVIVVTIHPGFSQGNAVARDKTHQVQGMGILLAGDQQ